MSEDHLDWGWIRRAIRGEAGPWEVVRRLLRHLLEVCPQCRQRWAERAEGAPPTGAELEGAEYAPSFRTVLDLLPARYVDLEGEREEAPALFEELSRFPEGEQKHRLDTDPKFQTWGICDLLIDGSRRAAFEDPPSARLLAALAIRLVDRLDPWKYGAAFLEDVRALAWGFLANARRVASDLRGAEEAMEQARQLVELGAGDPLVVAQLSMLEASLRRGQRRLEEADRLLDEVIEIYAETGESHLRGRALVKKAIGLREVGQAERAVPILREATGLIDATRDPRLNLCAHHNLICCLVDGRQRDEAQRLLDRARPLYAEYPDFSTQLRLRWVDGRLAALDGRVEEAEAALRAAREGFLANGIGYDAALVSLDLALLYLEHSRLGEVVLLAEQMVRIFHAQDVHREAVAALLIFQQAARSQNLTVASIEGIADYLRRARRDPALAYERPS